MDMQVSAAVLHAFLCVICTTNLQILCVTRRICCCFGLGLVTLEVPERRQIIAHRFNCGTRKDIMEAPEGRHTFEIVSPLRGLACLAMPLPPLKRWATICRPWRDLRNEQVQFAVQTMNLTLVAAPPRCVKGFGAICRRRHKTRARSFARASQRPPFFAARGRRDIWNRQSLREEHRECARTRRAQ